MSDPVQTIQGPINSESRRTSLVRKLAYRIVAIALALAFCELLLWGFALLGSRFRAATGESIPAAIADERLGHRPNPACAEHDSRGYRNTAPLERCDILALGDSQTYGTNADAEDAWPFQLQELTGATVYNAGFGGWGPPEYRVIWEELKALKPEHVVVGFYAGNDLWDAFDAAYGDEGHWELPSTDATLARRILDMEKRRPLRADIRCYSEPLSRLWESGTQPEPTGQSAAKRRFSLARAKRFLARNSKLYALLRAAYHRTRATAETTVALEEKRREGVWNHCKGFAEREQYVTAFEAAGMRTLFTPERRLCALNLQDERIQEGLRISIEAIREIDRLVREAGAKCLIVLIPTKELVFCDYFRAAKQKELEGSFRELVENEQAMWRTVKEEFEKDDLRYVDVLPALKKCLETGEQPYRVTYDGHPNAAGYRAIAQRVARELAKGDLPAVAGR